MRRRRWKHHTLREYWTLHKLRANAVRVQPLQSTVSVFAIREPDIAYGARNAASVPGIPRLVPLAQDVSTGECVGCGYRRRMPRTEKS
eukprot:824220-Rhodomonas_salina.4